MAANPMASRSAALAGAAQAMNKPKQNLSGASNGTIQGAHGGTQQLGQAAQRRLAGSGPQQPPTGGPSIPMPPVKGPNMAGGGLNGAPTPGTKPLFQPGLQPGQSPPIFAGGQQPGQPPVNQGPDTIDLAGNAPKFGVAGQQLGVQGPGAGADQMSQIKGQMQAPGGMGQISTAGGLPAGGGAGGMMQAAQGLPFGGGDKVPPPGGGGTLPGFMGPPGVHSMPGAPDGGILHMPGGPGQISLHGSPMGGMGLPTKPVGGGLGSLSDIPPTGQHPVWGQIAGAGGGLRDPRRDPMQTQASGPGSF